MSSLVSLLPPIDPRTVRQKQLQEEPARQPKNQNHPIRKEQPNSRKPFRQYLSYSNQTPTGPPSPNAQEEVALDLPTRQVSAGRRVSQPPSPPSLRPQCSGASRRAAFAPRLCQQGQREGAAKHRNVHVALELHLGRNTA